MTMTVQTIERRAEREMNEKFPENSEAVEETAEAAEETAADVTEAPEENDPDTAGEDEIFKKNKQIEELNEQLAAEKDKYLRVAAEYDNFRRRSLKDKQDAAAKAQGDVVVEFLSVIDNFERALAAETADENYKKGIQMIFNQYAEILKKQGVEEIDALGKPFDPNMHNAVTQMQDENFGEDEVCQVFQKGYTLNGKVIRPAMVAVANP